MTEKEKLLIEFVHFITYGTGLDLRETEKFFRSIVPNKGGATVLECLNAEGRVFFNELRIYMNALDGYDSSDDF